MKAMPYLIVTGDFVKTGGMDKANYALADYLARCGNEVHLVAHRVDPQLLIYPNVIFHRVPKLARSYFLSAPLLDWMGRWHAAKILKTKGRVVVNGGSCVWRGINWVHCVHPAYKPKVTLRGLYRAKAQIAYRLFGKLESKSLKLAQLIIANSDQTKRDLIDAYKIRTRLIHTVYLGVDASVFFPVTGEQRRKQRSQFGYTTEKPLVIFIGAFGNNNKGFNTVFAGWQRLCDDFHWDADLLVVGYGRELFYWQKKVKQCSMDNRIRFLGFRTDVPQLMQMADCLVAPSRYESYGLAVHEAICCGLPAIVSANAGIAERYPDSLKDLLLQDPGDVNELVVKLRLWRANMERYRLLVLPFSDQLRAWSWDDMAQKMIEIIEANENG